MEKEESMQEQFDNGVQAAKWWIEYAHYSEIKKLAAEIEQWDLIDQAYIEAPVLPGVKEREAWWVTYWEEREAVGDYEELDGIN